MSRRPRVFCALAVAAAVVPGVPAEAALDIQLRPNASLNGNAAALGAFERAAQRWEAAFGDSIVVTIDAGLAPLGAGVIGSASSVELGANGAAGFDLLRNAMVADAADEPSNAVVASLPTGATFTAFLPAGVSLVGAGSTKATLKALGFAGLDAAFGDSDAQITFSSNFAFDFDNSDGVAAGTIDFETVAIHEIGHTLGFTSAVDAIDAGVTAIQVAALDLFRFNTGLTPSSEAEFASLPRELRPGREAALADLSNLFRFSTGVNGGDGRQASHWKDAPFGTTPIGVMDPTYDSVFNGGVTPASAADLRAFDLIGWDLVNPAAVPEPGTAVLCLLVGGPALWAVRRRAGKVDGGNGTLAA